MVSHNFRSGIIEDDAAAVREVEEKGAVLALLLMTTGRVPNVGDHRIARRPAANILL